MRLPAYPKYKPSDVEWLGEVPAHWEIQRLRHVLARNDGGVWGDEDDPEGTVILRSTEQTLDGGWRIEEPARRVLSESEKRYYVLETGDLVVTKSSGSSLHIGKTSLVTIGVATLGACFSNFVQRLRLSNSVDPLLAFYLLNSPAGRQQLAFNSTTTTGLANLTGTALGNVFFAYPNSLREQRSISDFLARETAKIDTLVAKKKTLIDRLKEKHTALISRAVTRGLPPDAACAAAFDPHPNLKPSGIDCIGDVPEHWALLRIATESTKITNGYVGPTRDILVDDGIPYLQSLHIKDNRIVFSRQYFVTQEWSLNHSKSILATGDVLIVQTGDIGQSAVVPPEFAGANCHALIIVSPRRDRLYGAFLSQYLNSTFGFHDLKRIQTGALHPHLNCGLVRDINIPSPPLHEQIAIADYLEHETAKMDVMIAKVETAVERLQEYRTALITAAVTGKIDVRGTDIGVIGGQS